MAIRTDIWIDWQQSPRIIWVEAPSVSLSIQDLHDTCRDIEDNLPSAQEYDHLIDSAGKEPLGGGTFVGITATLQNALVAFEARLGPTEVQCTVSGGNLVAVDDVGTNINPIHPTAYTQVTIQQSTSPSIITPPEDLNLLYLVESLRGTSKTLGSIFYWDPEGGVDTNDGTQPGTAVATFSAAQTLATAGAGDVIFALANHSSGITTSTETINISKAGLKVRGPGHSFQLVPTTAGADTVTISADGAEFEGFYVSTHSTGTDVGINVTGDNAIIKDVWAANTRSHGISLSSTARTRIENCAIEDSGQSGTGNGINLGDTTTKSFIETCIVTGSASDGINLSGTGLTDNMFENNLIYNNSVYGIDVGTGVVRTGVRLGHTITGNTTGNTNDNGTDTFIETAAGGSGGATAAEVADAVWNELIADHQTAGSAGKTLKDAKTRATLASLK